MKIRVLLPLVVALICANISPAQEPEKPRPAGQEKMEEAKQRIQELRAAGKQDEAAKLEQWLREETAHPGDPHERVQHVAEAIKHLRAAGLNEQADSLEQMMRKMQQQKPEGHEQAGPREGGDPMPRAMREMHEQMINMQRAIDELREKLNKR